MMCLFGKFGLECVEVGCRDILYIIKVQPTLISFMIEAQWVNDDSDAYHVHMINEHGLDHWTISNDGGLQFMGHLFFIVSIQEDILREWHQWRLAIHSGSTKMYHDVA